MINDTTLTGASNQALPELKKVNVRIGFFGGGGGHISDDLVESLGDNADNPRVDISLAAFNTDIEDLRALDDRIRKFAIGYKKTGGFGAGSKPEIGRLAAEENSQDISGFFNDADIAMFVGCLGGGTGSGALPYAAELFSKIMAEQEDKDIWEKKAGIIIVTEPFKQDGLEVEKIANRSMELLRKCNMPIISIPNDTFSATNELSQKKVDPKRTLKKMYEEGNQPIAEWIGRMVRALGKRHNIHNIDRNDIVLTLLLSSEEAVLAPGSYFGVGYGSGPDRVATALNQAASNPYLTTNLRGCQRVLICTDCLDITEAESKQVREFGDINHGNPDAIWCYGVSDDFVPLPFEKDKQAEVAIFILGVGHMPGYEAPDDGVLKFTLSNPDPLNRKNLPPPALDPSQFIPSGPLKVNHIPEPDYDAIVEENNQMHLPKVATAN